MKITKTCAREGCKTKFTASGKGCSRAKYCLPCRPLVRREQFLKSEAKRQEKRFKEKGYIIPTDKQTLFYGYKEPLTKVEGGFGYRGVLTYSKDKEMVQCHFCGKLFRALNNGHLKKVHNLTALQYKEKVGLSRSSALMGEETSFGQNQRCSKKARIHPYTGRVYPYERGQVPWLDP